MTEKKYLYLMISRTDTIIGKVIRFFTLYQYNHVSLTLDPNLRRWVSFARYVRNVPLAGGFVEETADRLFSFGSYVPVRIFRIEIPESRYRILKKVFSQAGDPKCSLIYNTFGALASTLMLSFPVPGAYTCLEFADAVLEESCVTIRQLDRLLEPHLIYEGELKEVLPPEQPGNGAYFHELTPMNAFGTTLCHFGRLIRNTIFRHRYDLVDAKLKSH